MTCPIAHCSAPVRGPLRLCKAHYAVVPRPQQEALASYARSNKQGPAHRAAFERAVESIQKLLEARRPKPAERVITTPYRDD